VEKLAEVEYVLVFLDLLPKMGEFEELMIAESQRVWVDYRI
jgi:hypothetical protein